MRSLHLVTHPEATHVVERLVCGWYDSDLTARGAEQAERIAAVITARVPSISVKFKVSPGSISVLRQDGVAGDRQVISLNELGHLC